MIDEKIALGLEDDKIIDQIITGGKGTFTAADRIKAEEQKFQELINEFKAKGQKVPTLEGAHLFDNPEIG